MKYKSILTTLLLASLFSTLNTGCKDTFADLNTDPSSISKTNVPYLFTQSLLNFEPSDYLLWFYNGKYMAQWCQAFTPSGGYRDRFNIMGEAGGMGSTFVSVMNIRRDIENYLSTLSPTESAKYQNIQAMIKPLCVYLAMFDTDMYGSMPYSEACLGRYQNVIIPKYDTMEELYTVWSNELNDAIKVLSSNLPEQINIASQDFIYKGEKAKWLKFANAVKLKLAVRLLHQDKAKAFKMAEEVASDTKNLMSDFSDDFVYNKGSREYHFGNNVSLGAASKNVVDFMKKNHDARLRFMFTKNEFNSEVIQAFFDQEAKKIEENKPVTFGVPQYILDNVNYTVDKKGKKTFVSWKGMGEPWVRFYGLPVEMNAFDKTEYRTTNNYFDEQRLQLTIEKATKTYSPYSTFNQEMVRGQIDFTYPTKPDGDVKQDKEDVPWYGMAISTAEVNLYLAEFKLLGANLPKTAEEYYNTAVVASVKEYDRLARLNKIPYYDEEHCSDINEKPLRLLDGETDLMMKNEDFKLTGTKADKLEKVYLQQFLHFMYQPEDQYVSVRRSGVPKVGSHLIPWVNLIDKTAIPRRFAVSDPSETDLMYSVIKAAYEKQGFTIGRDDSSILNKERVWSDKGAPNFGEGPNIN